MSVRSLLHGLLMGALLSALAVVAPVAVPAPARAAASDFQIQWAPNGDVRAIATDGDTQFLGGDFTEMSLGAEGLAVVNLANSGWPALDRTFPAVDGTVYAVVSDGSGGWFVGGDFQRIGSPAVLRPYLAHVNSDGSVDEYWDAGVNGPVHALQLVDGLLYAGGSFTNPDVAIAALDPATGAVVMVFDLDGGTVYALWVFSSGFNFDPTVVAGGAFTQQSVDLRTARFDCVIANGSCTSDVAWRDSILDGEVRAVEYDSVSDFVYFGGTFTSVLDSQSGFDPFHPYLARVLDVSGTLDDAWMPLPNGPVAALKSAPAENRIFVGGSFTQMTSELRGRLAAFDTSSGSLDLVWDPGADDTVTSLALSPPNLGPAAVIAGGDFTAIDAFPAKGIASIEISAQTVSGASALAPDNTVNAVAVDSVGSIAVGGSFTTMATVTRNHTAALDVDGNLTDWDPNVQGPVLALASLGNNGVLIGGDFDTVNASEPAWNLAFVDRTMGVAARPIDFPVQADDTVRAITVRNDKVFIGGDFTSVSGGGGGGQRLGLARMTYSAFQFPFWAVDDWSANFSGGPIRALTWSGANLYAGGDFTRFEGPTPAPQNQPYAAVVNVDSGVLTSTWAPAPDGPVHALATGGSDTVYLGGNFQALAGGLSRPYAAAVASPATWTGDPAVDILRWNPQPNGIVRALLLMGPYPTANVLLGGDFTQLAGIYSRSGLAAVTATQAGGARSWKPLAAQPPGNVQAIVPAAGGVAVGGSFATQSNPLSRNYSVVPAPDSEPGPMEFAPTNFGYVSVNSTTLLNISAYNRGGQVISTLPTITASGPGITLVSSCASNPNTFQPITVNSVCPITVSWNPQVAGSLVGASVTFTFGGQSDSAPSSAPLTGIAANQASAPTGLSATPGDDTAQISFAPGSDGGAPITNYEYTLDGNSWNALSPDDTTSPVTITGLTNGTNYSIQLRAVTGVGSGVASSTVAVTPRTTASAPTGLVATPAEGAAQIAFTSGDNGGLPITNYQYSVDNTNWIALSPDDTISPVTISGLTNGTTYSIRLRAVTNAGSGASSAAVTVTPGNPAPPTPPSPVPSPALQPPIQSLSALVGTPVTPTAALRAENFTATPRFTVYPTLPDGLSINAATGVVTGTPTAAYPLTRHWITATAGQGTESAYSILDLTITATAPAAPSAVRATPGDRAVTVSWTPPATDGGQALTAYEVSSSPGGATCTVMPPATFCAVTGLSNGVPYTFAARARNAAGWSDWSSPSAPITPQAPISILITGTRTPNGKSLVIRGTTTGGLEGKSVTPWIRLAGQPNHRRKDPVQVSDSGNFIWRWKTLRTAHVYVSSGTTRSNAVTVAASRLRARYHATDFALQPKVVGIRTWSFSDGLLSARTHTSQVDES